MTEYEPCVPRFALAVAAIVMAASTFGALVLLPYVVERESGASRSTMSISTMAEDHAAISNTSVGESAQPQATNHRETSALRKHGRSHT